ncbi:MAG: thioredoxin TrxC [Pseudobdellovibrio sp.]
MNQTYVVCENCSQTNRVALNTGKQPICGSCKKGLPIHGAVVDGSDKNFQTLIDKSPLPVVVDVWAPWCGPCLNFAPTFKTVSEEFMGKAVFLKLNSEANQQTSTQLGIRSIPTLILFKNGKEIARRSGSMTQQNFKHWLIENNSI